MKKALGQRKKSTSQRDVPWGSGNSSERGSGTLWEQVLMLALVVIKHIPDDRAELAAVSQRIRATNYTTVRLPAHQLLSSRFDRAIDHQRCYNRAWLLRCAPPSTQPILVSYPNSAAYLFSLVNRMILQQYGPTLNQVLFRDKYILPVFLFIDLLLGFRFGKSILGV
jgi:hypothetical protein